MAKKQKFVKCSSNTVDKADEKITILTIGKSSNWCEKTDCTNYGNINFFSEGADTGLYISELHISN